MNKPTQSIGKKHFITLQLYYAKALSHFSARKFWAYPYSNNISTSCIGAAAAWGLHLRLSREQAASSISYKRATNQATSKIKAWQEKKNRL